MDMSRLALLTLAYLMLKLTKPMPKLYLKVDFVKTKIYETYDIENVISFAKSKTHYIKDGISFHFMKTYEITNLISFFETHEFED
jgi:hypothetical protein